MKKIFSLKIFALLFLLSNAITASAQKKKAAAVKKPVFKLKVKKPGPLDSITNVLKGHLLLPFEDCSILMPYGSCNIGARCKINNPGLTFGTKAGNKVRAAWEGIVSRIEQLDNMYVVIIQCGELFFAYSNLSKPLVKVKQLVCKGQPLGKILTDETGHYSTDFLLSAKKEINPTDWFEWNMAAGTKAGFAIATK
jgi:septal ring factor EnvC (AmiA/AmiB activator)